MTRIRWWTAIVGTAVALGLSVPALAPAAPAYADPSPYPVHDGVPHYKVDVENDAAVDMIFCIRSTTSMTYPRGSDRTCSKKLLDRKTETLYVDAQPGDTIYLDYELIGEHTHDGNDITGGHQCTATGTLASAKINCHVPTPSAQVFPTPTLSAFSIDTNNANDPAMSLLNLLAWCVTAAAVAGFIIVGMSVAIQLRRGSPFERTDYWTSLLVVLMACLLGMGAGPIVQFLHLA